ncbi:MAG: DNA recombination protein RmuC [Actinobacteria bacterium]|nr:MAG: DNA recombination protein RmuC [Actinomycetota bacterium]
MPGYVILGLIVCALVVGWLAVGAFRRILDARLAATDAGVRRLTDASLLGDRGAREVRQEVSAVREVLDRIQVREQERREREEQAWANLRRMSSVLSGSQRVGRAGERVLDEVLGSLPPSMLERDFRVNGRVVEFALVLPDGKRLPIDSKWPAERELQLLDGPAEGEERERAVLAVERIVARRAKEVSGYRDPSLTAPLAVAAVPDAAYAVLRRAHVDAYRLGVIVVPYSTALPIVLALHVLASRLGAVGDVQSCLADVGAVLDAMEATLENKLERASTMLANGTGELRGQVGQARTAVARARERGPEATSGEPQPDDARGSPWLLEVG